MSRLADYLGLARRAGKLVIGAENTRIELKRGHARLILIPRDASISARRSTEIYTELGPKLLVTELPISKRELSAALGHPAVSMVAITDLGFASMIAASLAEDNPERYGEIHRELTKRNNKADRRRVDKRENGLKRNQASRSKSVRLDTGTEKRDTSSKKTNRDTEHKVTSGRRRGTIV